MNKEVVSYHHQPYGDYQIGFCTVKLGETCGLILKVLRSKHGKVYVAFNSVKIGDHWLSDFSFTDKEQEKKFLAECLEQVTLLMNPEE